MKFFPGATIALQVYVVNFTSGYGGDPKELSFLGCEKT